MEEKVIIATLEEMKIHSVRFTMEDLTRRLRISKSSLYKIVASKEQLIHAAIDYLMAEFQRESDAVRGENFPLEEKMRHFIRAYTRAFRYFEHGIYSDLKTLYPKEWERWEEFRLQKIENLLTLLKFGINDGVFRPVNTAVLQRCLLLMSESLTDENFLTENNLTYSQAIESMCDLIFNGFLEK